jgi:hypothetical protein
MPAAGPHTKAFAHAYAEGAQAGDIGRPVRLAAGDHLDNLASERYDGLFGQPVNLESGYFTLPIPVVHPQHFRFSPAAWMEDMLLTEIRVGVAEGRQAVLLPNGLAQHPTVRANFIDVQCPNVD